MNLFLENPSIVFDLVIGLIFIIEGLVQIFTGKIVNYARYVRKYTPESIERFVRPSGVASVAIGIFLILFGFSFDGGPLPDFVSWIALAGTVICVIIYVWMTKKYLVKIKSR